MTHSASSMSNSQRPSAERGDQRIQGRSARIEDDSANRDRLGQFGGPDLAEAGHLRVEQPRRLDRAPGRSARPAPTSASSLLLPTPPGPTMLISRRPPANAGGSQRSTPGRSTG